ncbi:3-dehydroquinate dehydratase [Myxococcus stipitatus DSM 14675]|uniref:3-dehydroquinate dehydratase n=1 Tax=Myxococcus stipitatus (strain DSM 14675 / JCM 12634 / Mx s8) TaxID=1278073 RepID=L7U5A9_MYXSD|nr:type II 3-dehydroquinate dehydratase [Myxococcus stipitatus]AGC42767.1 3-dehydroquinate dehydratase [Myxococcus stipitatus DSM 14675]
MRLLVLHGPNLNLLGVREGTSGGTLRDLDEALKARAKALGLALRIVQSNHEGVLLDTLASEREAVDGILINPAGLFGSYALKEGLEAVGLPAIEVMLRPSARESVVAEACVLQVHGAGGFAPYLEALETFASGVFTPGKPEPRKTLGRKQDAEDAEDAAPAKSAPAKTLGKKAPALALAPKEGGSGNKTLGRKPSSTDAVDARPAGKTLGRGTKGAPSATELLTRALVRQKVSERLAGKLTASELAAWARSRYEAVQGGLPAEHGQKQMLEDSLQRLTLSHLPATRLSDEQLVDLMTRLDEG